MTKEYAMVEDNSNVIPQKASGIIIYIMTPAHKLIDVTVGAMSNRPQRDTFTVVRDVKCQIKYNMPSLFSLYLKLFQQNIHDVTVENRSNMTELYLLLK